MVRTGSMKKLLFKIKSITMQEIIKRGIKLLSRKYKVKKRVKRH